MSALAGGHHVREMIDAEIRELLERAQRYAREGDSDGEQKMYDTVIDRCSTDPDPAVRLFAAKAMINKGVVLGSRGQVMDAIEYFEKVPQLIGDTRNADFCEHAAIALINKAILLSRDPARYDDAEKIYDEVVQLWDITNSAGVAVQVAKALFNKACLSAQNGDTRKACAAYDAIVERFGNSETTELKKWVARALFNKGLLYGRIMDREAAHAAYNEITGRFSREDDPEIKDYVSKAQFNKGISYHF